MLENYYFLVSYNQPELWKLFQRIHCIFNSHPIIRSPRANKICVRLLVANGMFMRSSVLYYISLIGKIHQLRYIDIRNHVLWRLLSLRASLFICNQFDTTRNLCKIQPYTQQSAAIPIEMQRESYYTKRKHFALREFRQVCNSSDLNAKKSF